MKVNKGATFLISTLGGGGAEGVCVNVANGLAENGWKINLVVLNLNDAVYLNRVSDKVNLVVLEVNNARYSFWKLRNYLLVNKPEKILVFNYELAVISVLVRSFTNIKFKLIARNINTISKTKLTSTGFWESQIVDRLVKHFYCKVDHVVNQCNSMEQDLLAFIPNLIGKTSVIYNPVNKAIEDIIENTGFSKANKDDYLLCVGRLEQQKGFHYAIEAFSIVSRDNDALRLKIIGKGSLERALIEQAKALGVYEKIDFEGFKENVIPYYQKAKATLLTSLYEGFPNVLVESITLGTPVVSFNCPSGPSEIVTPDNGVLVKHEDLAELVTGVKQALLYNWNAELVCASLSNLRLQKIIGKYELLLQTDL